MTENQHCARVGHKGADRLAPGNTLASFDAGIGAGADMIEFDVISEHADGTGALLIAHDYSHAADAPTLAEGLDHLAAKDVQLLMDLKMRGFEERAVAALRDRDLLARTLVTTMEQRSLSLLRAADPQLRLSQTVPRVSRDYLAKRSTKLIARLAVLYLRRALPRRMAKAIYSGRIDAVSAHRSVVTPRMVRAIHLAGGKLYVWTVDDAREIAHFVAMDIDGVITNDPRLFDAAGRR
jgi:glycerophosphoryl diester phosphodiesterase